MGRFEEGGGVEQGFGIEKELIEIVSEVVVSLNVSAATGFGITVDCMRKLMKASLDPCMGESAFFEVIHVMDEERKKMREVGGVPVGFSIRFTETDISSKDELGEEAVVMHVKVLRVGCG